MDLTSLIGISGFNLAVVVVFSIFFLLAAFLFCSWCNQDNRNKEETEPLNPDRTEPTEDTEKVFQRQIRTHYVTLGDNLDSESGLLSLLFSKGVIDMREKQIIQAEKIDHVRNEKLLDQLLKKSEEDFSRFVDALKENNQEHIARILLKDGAALPVHINIETRLPVDVKRIELDLVRQFNKASAQLLEGNSSIDDLVELMSTLLAEVKQKKAVMMKAVPDHSIVIYFFCTCTEALENISREFHNGSLSMCIEKIVIQRIISTSLGPAPPTRGFINPPSINADRSFVVRPKGPTPRKIATVRFRVDENEYKRCFENFQRGSRLAHSITLIVYIQRSFRHWRSFKRQQGAENERSDVP